MSSRHMTDADVELLLTGEAVDHSLLPLARLLTGLRQLGDIELLGGPEPALRAAALVREAGSIPTPAPANAVRSPRQRRFSRAVAIPMLALFLLVGTTGLALASNSSAPGDSLYAIDRALERVGIGTGGMPERIAEAEKLALAGDTTAALEHAGSALSEAENEMAGQALLETAERLRSTRNGMDNVREVRDDVADMLEWMATTPDTGSAFGQGVAERAGDLGKGQAKDDRGPPDHAAKNREGNDGNGPPQDRPGRGRPGE